MTSQQLVSDYFGLAATVAANVLKRLPHIQAGVLDADDINQEACLGLLQAAAKFDASRQAKFKAYARKHIRTALMAGLRKAGTSLPALRPEWIESKLARPDEEAARAQTRHILHEAIASLPSRLRTLVEAHYDSGETMRAIGERLGLDERRVSRLHGRALAQLQRYLRQKNLTHGSLA